MKSWLESLLIALSMYSAIPVKCLNWTEKNLRNAMVFFPLVGLLCGVGLWLVWL
ncbi:MAG TPA: adenosylcobinamide-GDP ribazoletransferase, partial [Ruminococcus sp.]|nr:adenosylcobinamide-GDP ribazoletransferase [Ruminococcus sp.]